MERFLPSLAIGISLVLSAYVLGGGVRYLKDFERSVSVKGLDERIVDADTGILTFGIASSGNSPTTLYERIAQEEEKIVAFLKGASIPETNFDLGQVSINDQATYNQEAVSSEARYSAQRTITVSSTDLGVIKALSKRTTSLIKEGIVVTNTSISYLYTKLNDIKPEMLKRATENAREAATAFASNAGASIGGIKSARQGYFSILNPSTDESHSADQSLRKKVRVVTEVQFFLE